MAGLQAELKRSTGKEKAGLAYRHKVHEDKAGVEGSERFWEVWTCCRVSRQEEESERFWDLET